MFKTIMAVTAFLFLISCGGGGSSPATQTVISQNPVRSLITDQAPAVVPEPERELTLFGAPVGIFNYAGNMHAGGNLMQDIEIKADFVGGHGVFTVIDESEHSITIHTITGEMWSTIKPEISGIDKPHPDPVITGWFSGFEASGRFVESRSSRTFQAECVDC